MGRNQLRATFALQRPVPRKTRTAAYGAFHSGLAGEWASLPCSGALKISIARSHFASLATVPARGHTAQLVKWVQVVVEMLAHQADRLGALRGAQAEPNCLGADAAATSTGTRISK